LETAFSTKRKGKKTDFDHETNGFYSVPNPDAGFGHRVFAGHQILVPGRKQAGGGSAAAN